MDLNITVTHIIDINKCDDLLKSVSFTQANHHGVDRCTGLC